MDAISEQECAPILEVKNLTKRFGGLTAVNNCNIKICPGERRSIIGPNGAGKTTLFNMISGVFPPTSGSIYIMNQEVTRLPSYKRVKLGLSRTFQITNLFSELSVQQNIQLGLHGLRPSKFVMWRAFNSYHDIIEEGRELMKQFDLWYLRDGLIKNLSYGDQRLIEIIMGFTSKPKILALDEPSAGLSSVESERLVELLNNINKDLTIILIEHDMKVAFEVTEYITMLSDGEVVAEGTIDEVRNSEICKKIYLGVR